MSRIRKVPTVFYVKVQSGDVRWFLILYSVEQFIPPNKDFTNT